MKGERGKFFKRKNGVGDLLNESLIKKPNVNLQAKLLPIPSQQKNEQAEVGKPLDGIGKRVRDTGCNQA